MSRAALLLSLAALLLAFTAQRERLFAPTRHFPKPVYDFQRNPLTAEKVALGRVLFYDPILSADSTISCASCHSPYNAFAHTDHDLSHGIGDAIGTRNAPALFNLAWQPAFMWDGAVNHLDVQALAPISHPKEMGEDPARVVAKLRARPLYRRLFAAAFRDSLATGERLLKALSQFQLTLVSASARYDSVRAGKARYTAQEQKGYQLYQRHCSACHTEPLFSGYTFSRNGLPVDTTLDDLGRFAVTQRPADSLLFKVPSLRNLSYSYPYMHDGRFQKLGQVLQHYTRLQPHPGLPDALQAPITLCADDKADLIAFLLTLNDKSFVFDPRHQFPKEILQGSAGQRP